MPQTIRVATFNCENLFSRARIFGQPPTQAQALLDAVAQLNQELQKAVFDHGAINALVAQLSGFATINDVRGSHTTAAGAADFTGWVELTRDSSTGVAVENTARVIGALNADIICLVEVESRLELQRFHDQLLVPPLLAAGYERILLIDGNDERGIDVSIVSRFPIDSLTSHIHETTTFNGSTSRLFSRDCLEVRVALPGGQTLHLLLNHFKSKIPSNPGSMSSNERRRRQATRVAALAGAHNLQNELVLVAGDLNDTPTSAPLQPLLTVPGLFNVNTTLPAGQQWTFRNGSHKEQIDYLLVSDPLRAALQSVAIERRGIFSTTDPHFPQVVSKKSQASDHAAVVAEFLL